MNSVKSFYQIRDTCRKLFPTFLLVKVSCSSWCFASFKSLSRDSLQRPPPSSTIDFVSGDCFKSRVSSQMCLSAGPSESPRNVQTELLRESLNFLLAMWFSAITIVGTGKGMMGRPLSRLSFTNLWVSGEWWDCEWAGEAWGSQTGVSVIESQFRVAGKDTGSSSWPMSGDLILSFNINLVNDARKNFGIKFGDFIGESSKTPRFRLSRLLVFFMKDPGTASSTEDVEEVNSLFLRLFLSNVDSQDPAPDSAGVLGTDKLAKLNFGILVNREFLGRLEAPFLISGLSLEDKL